MHVNVVMSVSLKKAGIWSNIGQHGEDTEVYDVCHIAVIHDTAELQCEILNYVAVITYRSMFTSRCNIFIS